jgi:hypothetical protein
MGPEVTGSRDNYAAMLNSLKTRAPGLPIAVKPVPPGKLRAFLSEAMSAVAG